MKINDVFSRNNVATRPRVGLQDHREEKGQKNVAEKISSFEVLLNLSTRQTQEEATGDDDYYWQHQQQLEQSALTFNSLTREQIRPLIPPTFESKVTNEPLPKAEQNTGYAISKGMPTARLTPIAIENCLPELKTDIISMKTILTYSESHEKTQKDQTKISKGSLQPIIVNKQLLLPSFKNYQMTLINNKVELSLNTFRFSQQESNDLQVRIKQWLLQKGYLLKQLTINGVPQ